MSDADKVDAATQFVDRFNELASTLVTEYDCTMTCSEAEALAKVFKAFGYEETARVIIEGHGRDDDDDVYIHHDIFLAAEGGDEARVGNLSRAVVRGL